MTLEPKITYLPDGHRYIYPDGIEVSLDHFREDRGGGLFAEISISTSRKPKPGLLHHGRINLITTQSKAAVVKAVEERTEEGFLDDVDFKGIIGQVCYKSLQRWREGSPSIDLRKVEPDQRAGWVEEPFAPQAGASLIFGDGGSGKSLQGEAVAVEIASGERIIGEPQAEPCPVLILDWEADEHVHAERFKAICRGAGLEEEPPVFYRRQDAGLVDSVPALRKEVARLEIGFVIIDSMGAARGGEPESADTTIRLFNAARSLGVPWLGIDHVPKNQKDANRPFGSVYAHNLSRLTWGVAKAQEEGQDTIVISLRNHKRNNGPLLQRRAYRITFETAQDDSLEAVNFESTDVRDVPELAASLSVKTRIMMLLDDSREDKMKCMDVAEALEIGENYARARLSDLVREKKVVKLADGYWGLRHDE